MKLSVQERIILIIFVMVLISGLGVFWFVVPEIQKIQSSNITLETKQKELSEAQEKADTKSDIKNAIVELYNENQNLSELFFEKMDTVEADNKTRDFVNSLSYVKTYSLKLSEYNKETLSILIDTSGETDDESANTSSEISAEVGVNIVDFEVTIPYNRFYDFLDAINNYKIAENGKEVRKALYVNGFTEPTLLDGMTETSEIVVPVSLNFYSIERVSLEGYNIDVSEKSENEANA